jgi:hypothetical protein
MRDHVRQSIIIVSHIIIISSNNNNIITINSSQSIISSRYIMCMETVAETEAEVIENYLLSCFPL